MSRQIYIPSLQEAARKVEKSTDYFYVMKHSQPPLFDKILKLGEGDVAKGYIEMQTLYYQLKNDIADMYFYLRERKKMSWFYRKFSSKEEFSCPSSFIQGLGSMAFSNTDIINYVQYKKMEELHKQYNLIKEDL